MGETGDDGDNLCPLCMEEMDLTDRHFRPCQCGYQICVWCCHQIMELAGKDNVEGRCPACRTPYDKEKIVGAASNCEELIDLAADKKRHHKIKSKASDGRKHLSNVRVIQRNLVYVVGFPPNLADEENLEKREYFGQYGRILKVAVSRSSSYSAQNSHSSPSASVYITFVREEDALRCIKAVDGCILEGKLLRACFGTNKYCNAWLKNMPCNNPDCLYLHEEGTEEDSFTKEEMLAKYGSKHQHFQELTHPPHRAVGAGLPPPVPEASTGSCNSVSGSQHIQTQTCRVLGKSPVNSTGSGKTTNLPAAASWGMRGKAALAKTISTSSAVKKKSPVLMSLPSCSSSTLSYPPAMGIVPSAACEVEPSRVASAVDAEDLHACSSLNVRNTKAESFNLLHNSSEGDDSNEQPVPIRQSVSSGSLAPSIHLSFGDVSISLCSSHPIDFSAAQDDFVHKPDSFPQSSLDMERNQNETLKETNLISLSTIGEEKKLSKEEVLKASTSEPSVGATSPLVVEGQHLPEAVPSNSGNALHMGDDSIISEILTMDFDNGGVFASPLHLAKLLKAGTSDSESCKDLSVNWKPQSSSQSRFSFARLQDLEQLNGGSHLCSSSGDYKSQQGSSQMYSLAKRVERKVDFSSVKMNDHNAESTLLKEISAGPFSSCVSLGSNEPLGIRNATSMLPLVSTAVSAPMMGTTKARLYAPPGFSTPVKVSSVYPPGFNSENMVGGVPFNGLTGESFSQGVTSGLFSSPVSSHITDSNIGDVELIDPAIMAVGRGKLPLDVGEIGSFSVSSVSPFDAGQAISSIHDGSEFHHLFSQGTSSTNSDPFGYGPRLAMPRLSGTTDLENLMKQQQQRSGFMDDKYHSMPYLLERHFGNHEVHALSPLSSVPIDGGLPTRLHGEGKFTSPVAQNSAFHNGPNSVLNLTQSSLLDQIGLETSDWDSYQRGQRLYSNLRSSPVLGRLDARSDVSFDGLSLETTFKNIILSSSKHDSSRSNIDRYSMEQPSGSLSRLDFNGQVEFDRRW